MQPAVKQVEEFEEIEDQPSLIFLNMSGDIEITWDDQHHDRIAELIQKKMDEGYVFFIKKEQSILNFKKKVKLTPKRLSKTRSIVIPDEAFNKLADLVDDIDIAKAVEEGVAVPKRTKRQLAKIDGHVIEKDPKKVAAKGGLGVKRIAGG